MLNGKVCSKAFVVSDEGCVPRGCLSPARLCRKRLVGTERGSTIILIRFSEDLSDCDILAGTDISSDVKDEPRRAFELAVSLQPGTLFARAICSLSAAHDKIPESEASPPGRALRVAMRDDCARLSATGLGGRVETPG